MNVDGFLSDFDVAALSALSEWRQGHLVSTRIAAYVDVSQGDGDGAGLEGVESFDDTGVPYVAVVSQTCDVVNTGPGAKHPFVQVSPIRDVSGWDPGTKKLLARGDAPNFVLLTSPPEDGAVWAIDLRVTWPVSKAVLATMSPVEGFANSNEERLIGAELARKYDRPALPDAISTAAAKSLNDAVGRGMKNDAWADDVIQLRIDILQGTVLEPKEVRLYVISEIDVTPTAKREFRQAWKACKKPLNEAGISWVRAVFRIITKMPASEYRDSLLVRIPNLGSGARNSLR
jgi:hypothetical protein